ncbi:hypothetical protein C900_04781 [Fulvivirga imtechensis AK7]|uniref:Uncharacterized protein n=1 Tax=Fulvivirga imtechensis AK7 TaxID=1237149 RepID=L8JWY2_9BACT|nr:hypothetical protein C900_04781 [Fulvivirga imtechensis AK7]
MRKWLRHSGYTKAMLEFFHEDSPQESFGPLGFVTFVPRQKVRI